MKEDKLEKFVRDHRDDFDDEMPPAGAWEQVQTQLPVKQTRIITLRSFTRVAAIVVIGIIGAGLLYYFSTNLNTPIISETHVVRDTLQKNLRPLPETKQQATTQGTHTLVQHPKHIVNTKTAEHINEKQFPDELKEMQAYYTLQIENRRTEILRITSSDPEVAAQLSSEFSDIDRVNNDLKKDLHDGINNQEVVEAIVLNYKSCLETLDAMLEQLREKNV